MFDGTPLQSRIDLARMFNGLGFKVGAEIGVADGRYSEILCKEIEGLKLYCIDLWAPYGSSWRTQRHQDGVYVAAQERLGQYDTEIIRKPSFEASMDIEDGSLDFVFIDADHTFDAVMLDIIVWAKKVRSGGVVSGHDYCHFTKSGVIEAVNKYCEVHRIELNLIMRNRKNHRDDQQPCWWFVKK